jgi:hypothetical protein
MRHLARPAERLAEMNELPVARPGKVIAVGLNDRDLEGVGALTGPAVRGER